MASYSKKLTSEFTQEEWDDFRKVWMKDYMREIDCDEVVAEVRFEDYCGQEGWTGRDERISQERENERG